MTRPDRETLLAFGGILVVLFLASTNMTVVGTALPRIIAELDGFHLYAWAFTAFILTSTVSLPVYGRLSDTYGRKRMLLFGIVLFSLSSAAAGFAQSMTQLVLLRAVQGLGGGALMAMTWAVLGDLFTPRQRGAYQGFTSAVFGVSSVVGPILGGVITDTIGWRWVFFVNVPIALVALLVVRRYVPAGTTGPPSRVDLLGALLLTAATVPLLLALTWGGVSAPWGSPLVLGLLAAAALLTVAFIVQERRASAPILPLALFRERTVAVASAATLFVGGAMFSAIIYLPLYVQGVAGGSAAASGFALAPLMAGFVVASSISGWGVARSGRYRRWIVAAGVVTVVGFVLAAAMGPDTGVGQIVSSSVVLGLGLGPPLSLYVLASQNAVAPTLLGTVTSAVQFFRQIGGMTAVAAFGAVISARLQRGLAAAQETLAGASPEAVALLTSANSLTDPERMAEATALLARDLGEAAVAPALAAVRIALGDGMTWVFASSAALATVALIAAAFLPARGLADVGPPTSVDAGRDDAWPAPLEPQQSDVTRDGAG
jgi:EmrB/QacA subfamily drug resistance transporter